MRLLLSLALLIVTTAAALAQPAADLSHGRSGRIEFTSPTPTGPTQLVQRTYKPPVAIVGELVFPDGAAGKVPAIVIAHGSGGILPGREQSWAARLRKLGIATFVVDSFTPRGLRTTSSDQSQLSTMANVADALSALKLLATHPRIDAARIGVIGFSRGGQVALYTALELLRKGVIDNDLRFAAHIALYPSCNIPYRGRVAPGAPILMLMGAADDYTPTDPCLAYAQWFTSQGAVVETQLYPGAYHDFDISPPARYDRNVQTAKNCRAEVNLDTGAVRRLDTGEDLRGDAVAAYFKSCASFGAHHGGDPAALAAAERDVAAFLRKTLLAPK